MEILIVQHEKIVAGIDARDPEGAANAMHEHLSGILTDLPQIESDNPGLFA